MRNSEWGVASKSWSSWDIGADSSHPESSRGLTSETPSAAFLAVLRKLYSRLHWSPFSAIRSLSRPRESGPLTGIRP